MIASWPFGALTPMKYGAILVDPPWAYAMRSARGHAKSPEAHYETMDEASLGRLPIGSLAGPDCALFLWSTWPHLPQALRLMAQWGFVFKTGGSWTKTTPAGKRTFGTGYLYRSATEPWIVGTIGAPRWKSRSVRNLIEAPRREHSRKPDEMRADIERLLPDVWKAELFARETADGWECWGNEVGKFGGVP